jgi:hypothetical protein
MSSASSASSTSSASGGGSPGPLSSSSPPTSLPSCSSSGFLVSVQQCQSKTKQVKPRGFGRCRTAAPPSD